MKKTIGLALMLLAAGGACAATAHQHGVAQLSAAVDGNALELEFMSPLENLVGFEHAPRNARERQALQDLKARFASPQSLFVPAPAAGCQAQPAQVETPGTQDGGEHAELHAVIRFQCASPAALRSLELRVFEAFSRLQRVQVQLAAPGGQAGGDLSRKQRRLDW